MYRKVGYLLKYWIIVNSKASWLSLWIFVCYLSLPAKKLGCLHCCRVKSSTCSTSRIPIYSTSFPTSLFFSPICSVQSPPRAEKKKVMVEDSNPSFVQEELFWFLWGVKWMVFLFLWLDHASIPVLGHVWTGCWPSHVFWTAFCCMWTVLISVCCCKSCIHICCKLFGLLFGYTK